MQVIISFYLAAKKGKNHGEYFIINIWLQKIYLFQHKYIFTLYYKP